MKMQWFFYEINEGTISRKYKRKINQLSQNIHDQTKLADSLQILNLAYETALKEAEKLSFDFAKANLDDANEVYKKAYHFFTKGELEAALSVLRKEESLQKIKQDFANKKALENLLQVKDSTIEARIENILLQARIYVASFKFDSAEYYYKGLVEIDTTNVEHRFMYALFIYDRHRFSEAASSFKKLLMLPLRPKSKANILHNLGVALMDQNQYADAIRACEEALLIYNELLKEDPSYRTEMASTLNNLGIALKDKNQYVEAFEAFEEALSIYSELSKENSSSHRVGIANTLNNLGIIYKEQNKYAEAEKVHEEALSIYVELSKKNPSLHRGELASTLNNLGLIYNDQNRYEDAIKVFEKVLSIRRELAKSNPSVHLRDVAGVLHNLGSVYQDQNQYEDAIKTLEEVLAIYGELSKVNPSLYQKEVSNTLNSLGLIYSDQNRYEDAIKVYQDALLILRELAESNRSVHLRDIAHVLHNLGSVYRHQDQYADAIKAFEEVLSMYQELSMENPSVYRADVSSTLNSLGLVYLDQGQYAAAIEAIGEALSIHRDLSKKSPLVYRPYVAVTLNNLALVYERQGDYILALSTLREVWEIRKILAAQNVDRFGMEAVQTLGALGMFTHLHNGKDEEVIKYVDQIDSLLLLCPDSYQKEELSKVSQWLRLDVEQPTMLLAFTYDQIKATESYSEKVDLQKKFLGILLKFQKQSLSDQKWNQQIAPSYGSLSWYQLFTKAFSESEASARKGLEIDPTKEWIYSNLALSLLYQGKYEEAERIYLRFKDQQYDKKQTWKEVFLADLEKLKKAGITHRHVKKIKKLLKE
jgi:tetratricopeptide (TPR) repeat protein